MRRILLVLFFSSISLLAGSGGTGSATDPGPIETPGRAGIAGTTVWVLPHLFHLDSSTTASIVITNNSAADTISLQIDLRVQNSEGLMENQIFAQVAPRATRSFSLGDSVSEGFVGSAIVFCSGASCLVNGAWEFDFGPERQFSVGVPGISASPSDTNWAGATFDGSGNFALAIFNNTFSDNECTLSHFNEFGDPVGTETFTIGSTGQRAEFADVPEGFTGRTEVACEGAVWVTSVVQSPVNGFPTVGFPIKLTPEP